MLGGGEGEWERNEGLAGEALCWRGASCQSSGKLVMAESFCQRLERLCGDGGKVLSEAGEPLSEPGEAPGVGSSPRVRVALAPTL